MSWPASVSSNLLGLFEGTPYEIFPKIEEQIIDVTSDYIFEEVMKIIVI